MSKLQELIAEAEHQTSQTIEEALASLKGN